MNEKINLQISMIQKTENFPQRIKCNPFESKIMT